MRDRAPLVMIDGVPQSTPLRNGALGMRTQGSVSGTRDQFSFVASASRDERGLERDAEGDIMGTLYGLSESVTENFFTKLGYRLDDGRSLQLTYNYFEGQQNADLVDVLGSVNDGTRPTPYPPAGTPPAPPRAPGATTT